MNNAHNKTNYKRIKVVAIATLIILLVIGIVGYLIFDNFRKSVGMMFLYLAIDFISPQPDVDKLILIPFIYAPIIMKLGITRNYAVAYLIGTIISFCVGLICLLIAIFLLGEGTWGKFKDGVSDGLHGFYNLLHNPLFIIIISFAIILIILFAWYLSNPKKKTRRSKLKNK